MRLLSLQLATSVMLGTVAFHYYIPLASCSLELWDYIGTIWRHYDNYGESNGTENGK